MSRILRSNNLWKSVENPGRLGVPRGGPATPLLPAFLAVSGASQPPLRTCSACAGDYEDPDRTAWTLDPEEDQDGPRESAEERAENRGEHSDEFPAHEE